MQTKNVFVSHIHEDDSRLEALKELLESHGYNIRDGSIDSSKPNHAKDPDYIKSDILAPRINWAGKLIVLISPLTHTSAYVDWEIQYAEKKNYPIIGIWDNGAKDSDLPDNFTKYGDFLCGWDGKKIIEALEGKGGAWNNPEGNEYPERDIVRIRCQ